MCLFSPRLPQPHPGKPTIESGTLENPLAQSYKAMCLILFSINGGSHRLVVAANRDELYARPSARADFWGDHPGVLGGRDLSLGGTWLGINRNGRFAAVTNFREPPPDPLPPRSRGDLTRNFLTGTEDPYTYLASLDADASDYRGFNLVVGDGTRFFYYCNRSREIVELGDGTYGLSNQLLNCEWPKVVSGSARLAYLQSTDFCANDLFTLISDGQGSSEPFSAPFISSAEYGTCASTVLTVSQSGEVYFEERGYATGGAADGVVSYRFEVCGD